MEITNTVAIQQYVFFFAACRHFAGELKDEPIFTMTLLSKLQSCLSSGLPVVVMLNGESAYIGCQSGTGFTCQAGDHAGLARAVLQLLKTTPHERLEMGLKGRELSQRLFDRDTLFSCLEGRIGELCSGAAMSNEQWSRS